ncbi:MAG: nuclear transport factor 2 family protein [Steroidobacteraceae bacterium]
MKILLKVTLLLLLSSPLYATDTMSAASNKEIAVKFFTAAFIDKDLDTARSYLSDDYIQHIPNIKNGSRAFFEFVTMMKEHNTESKYEIKRAIAENDLVVLHIMSKPKPGGPTLAVIEIFRVANSKVVEHWNVKQEVPDVVSVNGNSFF